VRYRVFRFVIAFPSQDFAQFSKFRVERKHKIIWCIVWLPLSFSSKTKSLLSDHWNLGMETFVVDVLFVDHWIEVYWSVDCLFWNLCDARLGGICCVFLYAFTVTFYWVLFSLIDIFGCAVPVRQTCNNLAGAKRDSYNRSTAGSCRV
jgi:hypothetical protein